MGHRVSCTVHASGTQGRRHGELEGENDRRTICGMERFSLIASLQRVVDVIQQFGFSGKPTARNLCLGKEARGTYPAQAPSTSLRLSAAPRTSLTSEPGEPYSEPPAKLLGRVTVTHMQLNTCSNASFSQTSISRLCRSQFSFLLLSTSSPNTRPLSAVTFGGTWDVAIQLWLSDSHHHRSPCVSELLFPP